MLTSGPPQTSCTHFSYMKSVLACVEPFHSACPCPCIHIFNSAPSERMAWYELGSPSTYIAEEKLLWMCSQLTLVSQLGKSETVIPTLLILQRIAFLKISLFRKEHLNSRLCPIIVASTKSVVNAILCLTLSSNLLFRRKLQCVFDSS